MKLAWGNVPVVTVLGHRLLLSQCRLTAFLKSIFAGTFIRDTMDENDLSPEMEGLVILNFYEYIRTKALLFLEIGPIEYRKRDALGMPGYRISMNGLAILESGCRQVIDYKGLTKGEPFEGLGIPGFYRLMKLFHYQVQKQATSGRGEDYFLDEMYMKHRMTDQKMKLYNRVHSENYFLPPSRKGAKF
ncbi:MAG: hypothetical protein M0P58_08890 [Bacteroidales bacterium]|nr:hypothetical protein [Bacteroidales bacterium]